MQNITFIIPCYCSAHTVADVVDEITETMGTPSLSGQYHYHTILVNDGSPDDTYNVIRTLASTDPHVTGVNLARNFGQHAALMAGLDYALSRIPLTDIIVCLDDDGQTPANEVYKLLMQIEQGHDAVYASYADKQHSAFRNFGSRMNDRMARVMLGKPAGLQVTSYFAVKRFVAEEMSRYKGAYPYVIGLLLRTTKDIVNVPVHHRARELGQSGYDFTRLLSLWINGFTSFSVKPLRMATAAGAIFAIAGFLYGIYTVIKKLVIPSVPVGWSSLMAALLFIGGVLMLMLGMIGEYIGRIYISLNAAPQYVIREDTLPREVIPPLPGAEDNDTYD